MDSPILDQITSDLNVALKVRNLPKVSILRFLLARLHNAKIAKGAGLTDEEVITEIAKEAKRHQESIAAFKKAQRGDLVAKEEVELAILEGYLPKALTGEELEKMVGEAIEEVSAKSLADLGRVIKTVLARAGARTDGATVAAIAKRKLAGSAESSI